MATVIKASRINRIAAVVRSLLPEDFYGRIEINVFGGGITNVNVLQSFKPTKGGD